MVASSRSHALRALEISAQPQTQGRLLAYGLEESVLDGSCEAATNGFFDVEDQPPWDLWVGYVVNKSGNGHLVSWIPPALFGAAEMGIDVNPVGCLFWLEELQQALGLRSDTPA
jgi:hypothetical protein